jgi:glycosyltransferase involved in cell wall biosynthesis
MNIDKPWGPATDCIFDSWDNATPAGPAPAELVSVCITVFNYARFLECCLDSIKTQTHIPLDVIIIDDHSNKDDSVEVAYEWANAHQDRFHRIRVHSHCRNQGPAQARNTAFRMALGEFVFIIDADNEIYPRAIARLYEAALEGSFEATYSQIEKFGEQAAIGDADIWDIHEMHRQNYVDVMALIRRDSWEKIDGFSHIEDGWEDYDFWLKFIDAGLEAAYVPEILCRYRVHGKSRTATEAHIAHEDLRVLMAFRHTGFGIPLASAKPAAAEEKVLVKTAEIQAEPAGATPAPPPKPPQKMPPAKRKHK